MTNRAEYEIMLSPDAQTVRVTLKGANQQVVWGEMDASQLEGLIDILASARASMADAVPETLETNPRLQATIDPSWWVFDPVQGRVPMALRDPGLGWRVFELSISTANKLAETLKSQAGKSDTGNGPVGPSHH